jgi:hypothetical protein
MSGTVSTGRVLHERHDHVHAAIDYVPTIRERVLGSADAAEGIKSFVERRAARFTGS